MPKILRTIDRGRLEEFYRVSYYDIVKQNDVYVRQVTSIENLT